MMGSGIHRNSRRSGFTLLEVMIVVAIVTILAAIAYPSYQEHLKKGRRAAAQSYLMDLAQRQQQYLLDARAYAPDAATLSAPTPNDVAPYYTIAIDNTSAMDTTCAVDGAAPAPKFTVTATAIGAQVSDGDLKIDNRGTKCPSTKW
jgi:type IV pilus assembly protein PilE